MRRWRKPKGISAEQIDKVMKSKRVHEAVDKKAAVVQEYWKSVSPVFDGGDPREHRKEPAHGAPGDYRNSVTVVDISDADGFRDRVKPTDFKAKWIEFGVRHGMAPARPPAAPMSKTKAKFRK